MNEPRRQSIDSIKKSAPKVSGPYRVRACDLFGVLSRAADEAAAEAMACGLALTIQFDPRLRDARLACPSAVAKAVKATTRAMLSMTRRGAVSLRVDLADDHVAIAVASPLNAYSQPEERLFAQATLEARALDGRLAIDSCAAFLTLSLSFPAPSAPMRVLLIEPTGPDSAKACSGCRKRALGSIWPAMGQPRCGFRRAWTMWPCWPTSISRRATSST